MEKKLFAPKSSLNAILLFASRMIHILCTFFAVTLIVLDFAFEFSTYAVVIENPLFRKLSAFSGMGMLISGFAMSALMKKDSGVREA